MQQAQNALPVVAVVGAGTIGKTHVRAYGEAGARVAAVCDMDESRAVALAGAVGAAPYTSVAQMLDEVRPMAVSVCTPPAGHRPVVEAAAARGIPFLCEKPLADSLVNAQAILAAAEAVGPACMTGFCHRFHPPVLAIKEQLDTGVIGTPLYLRNRFAGLFKDVQTTWFADPAVSGGGTLMDSSVHSLDLYRFLIGEITRVTAHLSTHLAGLAVEDTSVLLINGPDGVSGTIEASWITPAGGSVLAIYGTEGTLTVDYEAGDFGAAFLQRAGEAAPRELPLLGPNRFTAEMRYFLESVATGRASSPSVADGLRAVQVIMAAYAAPAGVAAAIAL